MQKAHLKAVCTAAVAAVISVSAGTQALAQVPDSQTRTADPGRASERMREDIALPGVSPQIRVEKLEMREAPAGAEDVTFRLDELEVEGVSVYDRGQLDAVYGDRLGQVISLAGLYEIAGDLTRKYRNDGYALTQVIVPPQTIETGRARLQVVEGYISDVTIEGDETSANDLIRVYAAGLRTEGQALNIRQLERTLLLVNDLPGVRARSVLSPSPTKTGAADLTIIVQRDDFDGLLAADNHGSRYLGPVQFTGAASFNNLLGNNGRLTTQAALAPDLGEGFNFEMAYLSVGYDQPVWSHGTELQLFASYTRTEPGYDLRIFDVEGRALFFRAGLEHPFVRTRSLNLSGRAHFDWRSVDSSNEIEETREDRIRALRVGGTLEFLDTGFLGVGVNALDVEISRGLDIFGASEEGRANLTRSQADPTFWKLEADLQRLQRITGDINLLIGVRGQWANDALLSSEEFGVGGYSFGRAYDPSEIVGDHGIAGKLELQWNQPYTWNLPEDYQVYGFFDAGRVWNEDATSNDLERESATSTGFGIRTEFEEQISADFAVAFPLNRNVATRGDDDPRFYFSLSRSF